jgi:hypothetical protein
VNRVNGAEGRPVVFYLHPWEIDPDQPKLPAGWLGRFRHYHNLSHTEVRLRQLLTDFAFDTVDAVVSDLRRADTGAERAAMPLPYAW